MQGNPLPRLLQFWERLSIYLPWGSIVWASEVRFGLEFSFSIWQQFVLFLKKIAFLHLIFESFFGDAFDSENSGHDVFPL